MSTSSVKAAQNLSKNLSKNPSKSPAKKPKSKPAKSSGPSPAVMPTYARQNIVFEKGEGAWLVATSGERYLDFASGVAVNALGHAHPKLIAALNEQAQNLWHCSNLYRVAGQERLAERLCEVTFADKVFFTNSGAEACEGAIKLARRYHFANGHPERWRIVTFKGAFHGRTLATIAAAGNEKYLEGFGEPAPGFDLVPFGDLEAAEKAIGPHTAGILIEPVQGEGGVRSAPQAFFKALRQLCDEKGLLLAFDEVQTGMGRTGDLFAYKRLGVKPDVMSVAKALGGGFPIGACLATAEAADLVADATLKVLEQIPPAAIAKHSGLVRRADDIDEENFRIRFERGVTHSASLVKHFIHERAEVRLILGTNAGKFGAGFEHLYACLRRLALVGPVRLGSDQNLQTIIDRAAGLDFRAETNFLIVLTTAERGSIAPHIWRRAFVIHL
jgi:4-aminobutyrate aminotransferase-like enzyme